MSAPKARIWVVCADYTAGPYTSVDTAERALARFDCHYPHEIIKRVVKPVPPNSSAAWADDED